jgi:hypothetical protein
MNSPSVALVCGLVSTAALAPTFAPAADPDLPYPIVDTGQVRCYNDRHEIAYPAPGQAYYGQDAQYAGRAPNYRDNGDGTVTDLVTGLTWTREPGKKVTWAQAVAGAGKCRAGGFDDWRLPSVKELYSLILFSGTDPDPRSEETSKERPFMDSEAFGFRYGDTRAGERIIDAQWATSTRYVSTTMGGNPTMFGVNFADGRIKGYPTGRLGPRGAKTYYVFYVRANPRYGRNDFVAGGDGTVTDRATGLTWMQVDSGRLRAGKDRDGKLNWAEALAWAENLEYAGHDDWRLPNAKELQSIVDYSRSPATTGSAAIDPIFKTTRITVEGGGKDWPFFWTSTTHATRTSGRQAVYVAFGRATGYMRDRRTGRTRLQDVHGAGAQRSDPKSGDPARYAGGRGPQGDVVRIYNFVRCVRGGEVSRRDGGPDVEMKREVRPEPRGDGPRGGPGFIDRLDANGDGKVSRAEFDGPARHFRHLDRDGDGMISSQEAPSGPPRGR